MPHELEQFLRRMESDLADEYRRISARVLEDPGTAGDEGEENWAEFLRSWVPAGYTVVTKGRIIGVDGTASRQIDVLVLKPSYPPALVNKKMYLAGGVAAAFECKITLKKRHIARAAKTAAEIQAISDPRPEASTRIGTPYGELHSPIFYGLLAHSHGWTASSATGHITGELAAALSGCQHPRELLDVVCVADTGTWSTMRMSYTGPMLNMWHLDRLREAFPDGYASASIMGPPDAAEWPEPEDGFPNIPVAQLCAALTERLAWEDKSIRAIADYFRVTGMMGRGKGEVRAWPLRHVYSQAVNDALRSGRVEHGVLWSRWQSVYF